MLKKDIILIKLSSFIRSEIRTKKTAVETGCATCVVTNDPTHMKADILFNAVIIL